jgi:hypothetical protein
MVVMEVMNVARIRLDPAPRVVTRRRCGVRLGGALQKSYLSVGPQNRTPGTERRAQDTPGAISPVAARLRDTCHTIAADPRQAVSHDETV